MRKRLIAVLGVALLLAGCSASLPNTAEKCGGSDAGITIRTTGVLAYNQDYDSTGDAWICLLRNLVPDQVDQYAITQNLDVIGTSHDGEFGIWSVVYGTSPTGWIRLFLNP